MADMGNFYNNLIIDNLYRMNPNVKTRGGYTPLMLSAMHRRQSVFNLLLNTYGANPNIRFSRVCQVKIIHFQSYLLTYVREISWKDFRNTLSKGNEG